MQPQPQGPRSRLDHDQRRRQILDCAASLLAARPYGEVSMEDVASAVGVTRGLLHHYFGTKRDLYLELMRDMLRAIPVPVPEFVQGETPEQRFADSVDRWLDAIWENRRIWLAMLGGAGLGRAGEASGTLRGVLRSYAAFAETATREWIAHGRFTRAQMHTLLCSTLTRLVEDVLPLVEEPEGALR
jgi:AcrR family transcriptional regulator